MVLCPWLACIELTRLIKGIRSQGGPRKGKRRRGREMKGRRMEGCGERERVREREEFFLRK
jgi:hypothetical protein